MACMGTGSARLKSVWLEPTPVDAHGRYPDDWQHGFLTEENDRLQIEGWKEQEVALCWEKDDDCTKYLIKVSYLG